MVEKRRKANVCGVFNFFIIFATMKGGTVPILILLIIALILVISYLNTTRVEVFALPRSSNPSVFGRHYWSAFHKLANDVPCAKCKGFAEKFMVFFHDTVNLKLGKPIFNQPNFDYFTQLFSDINAGKVIDWKQIEKETA